MVGGFIGVARGNTTIRNCYASGNINIKNSGNIMLAVGGFVGANGSQATYGDSLLTITNSYASGDVVLNSIDRTSYTANREIYIGGFLGRQWRIDHALVIENCAALNPRVIARTAEGFTNQVIYGRIISVNPAGHNVTLTNNHALETMPIGPTTSTTGDPATTIAAENAAHDNINGANQPDATLRTAAFWTDTAGWNAAIWDLSNLATSWPTLK